MKKTEPPILFILSGLPASGKSTLSKFISKEYQAAYLRIDTIEQALRDLFKQDVYGEGYGLAYKIANDNLKLGPEKIIMLTTDFGSFCNIVIITGSELNSAMSRPLSQGCISHFT